MANAECIPWTAEDITAKQGLIRAKAYQHWRPYAFMLDATFREDLEQEAWAAALAYPPDHPWLAWKIDYALWAYLAYWRLGLRSRSNTTAPRRIMASVPITHSAISAALDQQAPLGPEPTVILRDVITRVWHQCTGHMQLVWMAQLMQNSLSLKRRDYRVLGLSATHVSRARKRLQVTAREVLRLS